eukprot:gene28915-35243_t
MLDGTSTDWHVIAKNLRPDTRLLIDGTWCDAVDGSLFASVNPSTGEEITRISCGNDMDIKHAAEVARKRFRQGAWSQMPSRQRMDVIYRLANLIESNTSTFAVLDTLEMGKPISEMLSIDVPASVLTLRFMAECIDKIGGACPNTDLGSLHYILRQPLGVVGCITPWNYPLMMAVWKIAPALAA